MKRFLVVIVGIWGICLLFVTLIAVVERKLPPSEHLQLWRLNTNCTAPCLLGITPGQTTLENARQNITTTFAQQHYTIIPDDTDPSIPFASLTLANTEGNQHNAIHVALLADKGSIQTVGVQDGKAINQLTGEMPTLGEVVAAFGPPTCIIYYLDRSPTQSLIISYAAPGRSELLHIEVDHNNPNWMTRISTLTLSTPNESPSWCNTRADIYTPPWQGLISEGRYETMNQQ